MLFAYHIKSEDWASRLKSESVHYECLVPAR